jgi:hypothetical protein
MAAAVAGVSVASLYAWLRAGRERRSKEFVQFLERVKKAEAEAVLSRVRQISRAADTSWQAAAWWLERTQPDEFGRDRDLIRQLERDVKALSEWMSKRGDHSTPTEGPEPPSIA